MAFIRAGATAPVAIAPGTRPGPGGSLLLSTGAAGMDAALGGGLSLGRCLALDAGPGCVAAEWLLRLFVAEGVAKGHPVLWVSDGGAEGAEEADRWWLPSPAAARRARDPHPALGDDGGTELRIAWQYRRYLGAESGGPGLGVAAGGGDTGAGTSNPSRRGPRAAPDRGAERGWCGDYDLMRPLQAPHQGVTTLAAGVDGGGEAQSAVAWVRALAGGGGPPARLAIDATRPDAWSEGGEGLVRLLWQLRAAVQGARAAALVVVCTDALPPPLAARALAAADGVARADALRSDAPLAGLLPDAASACAAVRLVALPPAGAGAPPRPARGATLLVARARRGRLGLTPAEVDPDAEAAAAGGGAGGASASRPACAPGPGGASALDF